MVETRMAIVGTLGSAQYSLRIKDGWSLLSCQGYHDEIVHRLLLPRFLQSLDSYLF